MRKRFIILAVAAATAFAACSRSDDGGGAVVDVVPEPAPPLYSPESRDALALGLPDLVGGHVLLASDAEKVAAEEHEYVTDPRVKRILVERGFGPSRVTVEQKSDRLPVYDDEQEQITPVSVEDAHVRQIPADTFIEWDPTFYLLLTSVDAGDYLWQGEKPDDDPVTIAEREVRVADFDRFKVAWYPYGDVLYVVVAASDQLLEATVRNLPWPRATA